MNTVDVLKDNVHKSLECPCGVFFSPKAIFKYSYKLNGVIIAVLGMSTVATGI